MELRTLGLITNPVAGLGAAHNLGAARRLLQALDPPRLYTGPGALGAAAALDLVRDIQVLELEVEQGRQATQALARQLASQGVDLLAVVGGDGTLADVAFALQQAGLACPILGVGAGSINAGELVTCRAAEVSYLQAEAITVTSLPALAVGINGRPLALALNDVVVGTTVVGMLDGKLSDLDAACFMDGVRRPGQPRRLGSPQAEVTKVISGVKRLIARGLAVGTVIAGFSEAPAFYGKAIAGAVLLASLSGAPAGCLVCTQPLVRTSLDPAELDRAEPVGTTFVSLSPNEQVEITGLGPPAILCADGNPLHCLQPADVAQVWVLENAVQVCRAAGLPAQAPPAYGPADVQELEEV